MLKFRTARASNMVIIFFRGAKKQIYIHLGVGAIDRLLFLIAFNKKAGQGWNIRYMKSDGGFSYFIEFKILIKS